MWLSYRLLVVVAIDIGFSFASAPVEPGGAGRNHHLATGPDHGVSQQSAKAMDSESWAVGSEIQRRLEPLERFRAQALSLLRDSLSLPGWDGGADARRRRAELAQTRAEINEGLRRVLSDQRQAPSKPQPRQRGGAGGLGGVVWKGMRSFRRRFRSSLGEVRDLVEAVAGNHPEIQPEEAAESLRRMLEKNQRELQWHITKANGLLVKWASQVSAEERRLEDRLSKMREAQRAVLSGVVTTAEASLHKATLETQIEAVRKEWSERQAVLKEQLGRRQQEIAQRMLSVTRDSKVMAKIYDEFLSRKRSERDTSDANEEAFRRALELILEDAEEGRWEQVVSTRNGEGVTVQRKFVGRNSRERPSINSSKFACIRAWCTMKVPAEAIAELFESSERVKEYNKWFLEGRDLELLDDDTKVVWASSPAPPLLPFVKPRDFVTVVNVRRLEDGSIVVVNRGYRHPDAPPSDEYVRGEVILGANVIRPDSKDKNRTHFTMLTQVDPGGIAPAWIVNKISARDPVDFLERVEAAAGRSSAAAARTSSTPSAPSATFTTDPSEDAGGGVVTL